MAALQQTQDELQASRSEILQLRMQALSLEPRQDDGAPPLPPPQQPGAAPELSQLDMAELRAYREKAKEQRGCREGGGYFRLSSLFSSIQRHESYFVIKNSIV